MEDKRAPAMLLFVLTSLWCCCGTDQVSLEVSPGTSVFEGGGFVLRCVPSERAADWSVQRNTSKHPGPQLCDHGWGKQLANSCKVGLAVRWDTGQYWCRSTGGAVSNAVSIRVAGGPLLVEVPTRPVTVGEAVTLSCLNRDRSIVTAHFYRDDRPLTSDPRRDLELAAVSWSERGSYWCGSGGARSEPALLKVQNRSAPQNEAAPAPAPAPPPEPDSAPWPLAVRLLCHLLVFCPYCVSTVLMVRLCRQRPKEVERPRRRRKNDDREDAVSAVITG